MAALLKSLFFVFDISFLRNNRINYYDYIENGRVGYNVIGVYRWIFPKFELYVVWSPSFIDLRIYHAY